MARNDPQPVHTLPIVKRSALHVPVRLTSHTDAPRPAPLPVQTDSSPRGNRRLVRRLKGTS